MHIYQMILVARDGEAFKTHASMYNAKKQGEIMVQEIFISNETGKVKEKYFRGTEMTSQLEKAPKEVINELWYKNQKDEN